MTSTSSALSPNVVPTTPDTFRAQTELFAEANRPPSEKSRRKPKKELEDGLKAPSPVGKNFILDTNVLLHDPECLLQFADNHVCIPLEVLCELDKFKGEQSERGANARSVHRTLSDLFSPSPENAAKGIPTDAGGSVRLVLCRPEDRRTRNAVGELAELLTDLKSPDHRILLCTKIVGTVNPAPAVLVTKDLNLRLKALALGIKCEDYENDKVVANEADERKLRTLAVIPTDLQRFASSGTLTLDDEQTAPLGINDYLLLEAGPGRTMPARYIGDGELVRLRHPDTIRIQRGTPLRPLNLGQQCFLDALLNPDISLVTCYGQAGTGKTLLAVAAGLHATMGGEYNGVTVSRPVVAMGDTLGFLPGSLEEKLDPWLKPIFDALEFLLTPEKRTERGHAPKKKGVRKAASRPAAQGTSEPAKKVYQPFLDSGLIEVEALCYIRGRSIPKRYFILDEAQQLTPLEAKTIVTRMAQGSKLILVGDPAQIDNPYVDRRSNGLVYTRDKLRHQKCSAHVALERGERSELAEAGARLM